MKKVYLIHGFGGQPNGGWRPWLMGMLARVDIWACAPAMPTPSEPKKDAWVKEMQRVIGEQNENTFLVGHSLGVPAVLRYLESLPIEGGIGGAVLVSGFMRPLATKEKYKVLDNFVDSDFNFEHIKKVCKNFVVIHGDDDEAVPFSYAKELSTELGCKLIPIPNGSHLSDNWYELPEAFDELKNMLNV